MTIIYKTNLFFYIEKKEKKRKSIDKFLTNNTLKTSTKKAYKKGEGFMDNK